jgi:bacterial/archaeal transporter family-2 protein
VAVIPLWTWCGGLLGAAYLTGVVVSVGRLGAASTVALVVFGQITTTLLLDHFGFLMTTAHPISPLRLLGGGLLLIGVILVTRN